MKKLKKLICIICSLAAMTLLMTFSIAAKADFGDINDYGSGSDWSSSGSDWDYGGSSDYSGSYDYDYSGSSSDGDLTFVDVIIVVVIIALGIVWSKSGSSRPSKKSQNYYNQNVGNINPNNTDSIISKIKSTDPDFSYDDFASFVKRSYVDMQEAWSRRDITELQTVLHPNLYEQTQRQVDIKKRDGIINKIERVAVNSMYLTNYVADSSLETLTVILNAQMVDYQVDEKTGNVVAGDRSKLWQLQYRIKLVRSAGVKTLRPEERQTQSMDCPNCGAHLPAAFFGKCEYCGSIVTSGKYGWVISEISSTKH